MKISITRIGNSRGVRLPKAVLDQCGFGDEAELSVADGAIVLRPSQKPREGWESRFPGGDKLAREDVEWLDALLTSDDERDWTWPDDASPSRDTTSGS